MTKRILHHLGVGTILGIMIEACSPEHMPSDTLPDF
jgi:hypothetical protein